MATIIIGGYAVRLPLGGNQSWALQWVLGFHRLGHEVYFVEKSGWPNSCFNPFTRTMGDDCSAGTAALAQLLAEHGLERNWCYVDAIGDYHGMPQQAVQSVFQKCDVFLDLMRAGEWIEEARSARTRVMVDQEPAYTQMQIAKGRWSEATAFDYDYFYTVGLNVGTKFCSAPSAGKAWRTTFNPVVADLCPVVPALRDAPYTTVMNWESIESFDYGGTIYGSKNLEFPKFLDLPSRVKTGLEIAVSGGMDFRSRLQNAGWRVVDGHSASATVDVWRHYIQSSRGEFGVCKNYYVATRSGWFSDRSAVYLASGRPVVIQDTGFGRCLPCGRGLFAVNNVDEAAAAIGEVEGNYQQHSKWAREIAKEYLDTPKVLGTMLYEVGVA